MGLYARALAAYQDEEGTSYHSAKPLPERMYAHVAEARREKFQPYIEAIDRVFEFGVGTGLNLARLKCADRVGLDLSLFLRSFLEGLGIRFFGGGISILGAWSYDVVICHHVLEHVPNPWGTLEELYRVLKDGGKLLLFVPYEQKKWSLVYEEDLLNGHMFAWTPQTIATLAHKVGFKVEEVSVQKFGYDRFAAVVADKFYGGLLFYKLVRRLLLSIRPEYEIKLVLTK